MTPAELTSLNNFPYRSGSLSVQVNPGGTTFTASFLDQAVTISGSTMYQVTNQFFEITDQASIAFSCGFYSALAAGKPVDAAVAEAKRLGYEVVKQ